MATLADRDSVLCQARADRRSGSAAALFGWLCLLGGVIAGVVVATGTSGGEGSDCGGGYLGASSCPPVSHPFVSLGVSIALSAVIVGTLLIAFGGNLQLKAIRTVFELD